MAAGHSVVRLVHTGEKSFYAENLNSSKNVIFMQTTWIEARKVIFMQKTWI